MLVKFGQPSRIVPWDPKMHLRRVAKVGHREFLGGTKNKMAASEVGFSLFLTPR